jgi:cytochrome c
MSDHAKGHGQAFFSPFWDQAISAFWLAFLAILVVNLIGNYVMTGSLLKPDEAAEMKFGFAIEVAAAPEPGAPGGGAPKHEAAVPLIAAASPQAGAEIFRKCGACHTAEAGGANKTGPNLHNIVGDTIGDRNGYKTTDSLKSIGGSWTYEKLDDYIENPKHLAPKGSMSFAGLPKAPDRAAVIKYLMSQTDSPPALPAEPAADAAPADSAAPAAEAAPAKK